MKIGCDFLKVQVLWPSNSKDHEPEVIVDLPDELAKEWLEAVKKFSDVSEKVLEKI